MIICSICKNLDGNETFVAREAMYGHGDEFEYVECARCGCLQIAEIPINLSKYYPKNYYSFHAIAEEGRLKQFFIRKRTRYLAGHENLIGRLYNGRRTAPLLPVWLNGTDVDFEAKILNLKREEPPTTSRVDTLSALQYYEAGKIPPPPALLKRGHKVSFNP